MSISATRPWTRTLLLMLAFAAAGCLLMLRPAWAAPDDGRRGRLVDAAWLQQALQREEPPLLLDASVTPQYAAKHIAGAVSADLYRYGNREVPTAAMEQRLQSWGVSPGRKIVVYDQGGSNMATRLFFDLYYQGVPAEDLFILDGGLSAWQAAGGPVTQETAPAPKGSFRIQAVREEVRVRLPEFLNASGDPVNHAVVEALEPSYHFGESRFFDRAGHVPHAIMLPGEDFYNADKTFKSAEEIARMVGYLGIRPEQQIHSYCGGGVAASVPFFALKFILGYPQVKLYKESQLEWLQDSRGLPLWTEAAPQLKRDSSWLNGWGSRMMRVYGGSRINVIDVRPPEAYRLGHMPYALSLPAELFRGGLAGPAQLAALAERLGPAGVNAEAEAVIVSEGGLNPRSALAFLALERLGHPKVSVLMDSVDEWGLKGLPLAKEATVIGAPKAPQDLALPASVYAARPRPQVLLRDAGSSQGAYPKVFIASGQAAPVDGRHGKTVHLPYQELLNADGTPKAAKDIWQRLVKAGVPRYAEIVCFADDPGEAAVNYYILKLMGFPDVKVLLPA